MDRYYTMRPINLAGQVAGYRAELVGVGSGADAVGTIMQNAINRVGVSITPRVCQQLFIEVFNAAVDFACDSGTSVNLADIISFKWNTRGKYDRIDATVPKSALSLTAVVSPKITRNAEPQFALVRQPTDPTIVRVADPLDTTTRGVIARGFALSNLANLRVVDANTRTAIATYARGTSFEVTDNGRDIKAIGDAELVQDILTGQRGMIEFSTTDASDIYTTATPVFNLVARSSSTLVITGATPQPYTLSDTQAMIITGSGLDLVQSIDFDDFTGAPKFTATPDLAASGLEFGLSDVVKHDAWAGGPLVAHFKNASGDDLAVFNIAIAAYSM